MLVKFDRLRTSAETLVVRLDQRFEVMPAWRATGIVALSSFVLCLALYAPPLWIGLNTDARIWDFVRQAHDPLARNLQETILAYRPVHPLILYSLGIRSALLVYLFPVVYAVGFLSMLFVFLRRHVPTACAALFCAALSTTMVVQASTFWLGYPDALCWCIALVMLMTRHAWLAVVLVPLGMLADERFILTASIVTLIRLHLSESRPSLRALLSAATPPLLGVVLALAIRHALRVGWIGSGIVEVEVYELLLGRLAGFVSFPVRDKPILVPLAIFFAFRFAWLLPALALKESLRNEPVVSALAGTLVVLGSYAVFIGGDWTRSMAYLFPILVLAVLQMEKRQRNRSTIPLLLVLLLNVATPQLNVGWSSGRTGWVRPLPVALLQMWTGRSLGELLQ
jgi:hypothetical protein